MGDSVTTARAVLAKRDLDGSQFRDEHDETCAYIHPHCLIEGLVAEIARLRDERDTLLESQLWGVACKPLPPGPEGEA
jgi:hypothetical protein